MATASTKASKEVIAQLETLVNGAAAGLAKVAPKKMFGCHGLFANDNVFALVWKEGRIAVRLPEAEAFESLMGMKGAAPWKAGVMTMSHWVMVPQSMHDKGSDGATLKKWVAKAHSLAMSQVKPAAKSKANAKATTKAKPAPKAKTKSKSSKSPTSKAKSKPR